MEQTGFLKIEKRFKNNDFRSFFAKNGKFDDKTISGKFEKNDFLLIDFFKNLSYSKFNADFNAKNRF